MSNHVLPRSLYFGIFFALLVLTGLTVGVAVVDLGVLNTPIAVTIACTKALLVILFFMHVRYSSRLTWVVVSAGFIWLLILLTLTLSDYLSRGWLGLPQF